MDQKLAELQRKKFLMEEEMQSILDLSNEINGLLKGNKQKLENIEEKLKAYPSIDSDIVTLNIGGTIFATYKTTLCQRISKRNESINKSNDESIEYYEPHLLECLVTGLAKARLDTSGAIFINRNPTYFHIILDFLRSIESGTEFNVDDYRLGYDATSFYKMLAKEAAFYNLSEAMMIRSECELSLINSSILIEANDKRRLDRLLTKNEKHALQLSANRWSLLYRASRDGFDSASFHCKCDGMTHTFTLVKVKTNQFVFGGYASVAWDSTSGYKNDPNAFIFSLINRQNEPIVMNTNDATSSLFCYATLGPTFGIGSDIYISSNANLASTSSSNLGFTYVHPKYAEDSAEAESFLAGSFNFLIEEIEVFQIDVNSK